MFCCWRGPNLVDGLALQTGEPQARSGESSMKIFLQIVLVLLCVFFLLMSACGGLLLVFSNSFSDDRFTAVLLLVLGAALTWLTISLFRQVSRKKEPEA